MNQFCVQEMTREGIRKHGKDQQVLASEIDSILMLDARLRAQGRQDLESLLGFSPAGDWRRWAARVGVARKKRDIAAEARAHYELGLEYFYNAKGESEFSRLGFDRTAGAINALRESLALQPNNVDVRDDLVSLYVFGEYRPKEALVECLEILKIAPEDATTCRNDYPPTHYYERLDILVFCRHVDQEYLQCVYQELLCIAAAKPSSSLVKRELRKLEIKLRMKL